MILHDVKLDYSDVMLLPKCGEVNSRSDVVLERDGVVPIIAANMDGVGTFEMATELGKYNIMTALHKHYELSELVAFFLTPASKHAIYSMGANDEDFMKFQSFFIQVVKKQYTVPTVCIDVANGYTKQTVDFVRYVKDHFPIKIIAGNVVTPSGVAQLADAGADVIKIGIGPGSVCMTRKLTGIGYPQFSAVLECAEYADNFRRNVQIIADGGITSPGDIAKALAAGADYVMIGGMFAGHDEGGGEPVDAVGNPHYIPGASGYSINYNPTTHRKFYGMASKSAQDKHNGGVAEYRASEGKDVLVPYRGPVKNTVQEILGGLRSSCAYLGVKNLSDISKNPEFIRVNNQLNNVFGV